MYINRMLVLGIVITLVAFPVLADWLTSDYTAWYRPYIIWCLIIIFTWWAYRSRHPDEL
ncbi:hypothetical protein [Seongchinamella unica]|uniref:hypothetical protein n=1 Tax=Seongchinamella unica TaxID=2547392 RepID=UPI001404B2D0|nr:hypothetical protein [Seongchinamella unica]